MRLSIQNRIIQITNYVTPVFGVIAFVSLFLTYGFHLSVEWEENMLILDEIIAAVFVLTLLVRFLISDRKWQYVKQSPFEFILLFIFIVSIILEEVISIEDPHYLIRRSTSHSFIKLYFIIIQVYIVVNGIISLAKNREKWLFFSLNPARILTLSYVFVIVMGMFMLKLPKATVEGISWTDAAFTSASAVCITGLSTVNITEVFSFEGQVVIMLLIQLGGLGIITLTSFIALFIQRGFRLRDQIIVQEVLDSENLSSLTSILKAIVAITFVTELAGALGLYISWGNLGLSEFDRIFAALFHSVSAYCNAGFSIFPQGFETAGLQFSGISLMIVMVLIVFGGLGFYTYSDMFHIGEFKITRKRGLSLQSKVILYGTGTLILVGALLVWITQHQQWSGLSAGKQILNAFFLSITSRTAGFSTVSIGRLATPTLMILMMLMYIGGAPNSTSGGIKLTTVMTLLASIRAFVRGKSRVELGWNTIPMRIVRRAYIVFSVSVLLVFIVLCVLTWTEDKSFMSLVFEVISAFGTVGLSTGITPDLTTAGKFLIILMMFAGRIGLFTFAVAMSEVRDDSSYAFPEINITVG
ncbi:MAG: TrkH family potassium uptake protein [Bacteroidales bacterium]